MPKKEMGACGLICQECSILRASFDREEAKKFRDWLLDVDRLDECVDVTDFMEKGPYCTGCHGDVKTHWAPDCWILDCCVNDKDLDDCSKCDHFPCDRLIEWAKENEDYAEALERLRDKKSKAVINPSVG